MADPSKTNQELLEENYLLQQRIKKLERLESRRKRAEAALRESEEKYRLLIENSHDIIYMLSPDGVFLFVSPSWTTFLGHPATQVTGKAFQTFVHPDDVGKCDDFLRKVLETGQRQEGVEYRVRHVDGSWRWHTSRAVPVRDEAGTVVEYEGIANDITERKQVEERLCESERRYREFFATSRDCVFITSKDGSWLDLNEAAVELFGYSSREELMQVKVPNLYVNREERANHISIIAEHGSVKEFPVDLRRKDGKVINTLITSVSLFDAEGNVIGLQGTIRNITERKRAEEIIHQSEEKFRTLFMSMSEGFYLSEVIYDDNGNPCDYRYLEVNPKFEQIIGLRRDQIIGKRYKELVPADTTQWLDNYCKVAITGEPRTYEFYSDEYRMYFETYSYQPAKDQVSVFVMNVTDRKLVENEKRSLEERLQRAEKMEALGTLAGGVAHDLNNVLGIVVGYAELLLNSVDELSSIRPGLLNIMNGGQRAAAIVQDLLTLARRGVSGRRVLNLNKIIADCQQSPEFKNLSSCHPSVRTKVNLDPDLLNISGSSVHLEKALYNLVLNASESMTKGGIVTIKTANQYLDKPIQGYDHIREGDYVVLSVSDTGEGIPAADLKRIFEPFYTKKVMGRSGTGLGLAVVWGTVKDHHGYINVESEEGKGSTFTLYFPVTREDISSKAVAVSISEYMGRDESVLIVDDIKEQRELAAEMLQRLNYNVTTVSSGEEAVAYFKEHHVDLMVLDMIMDPGMDGLDTYKSVLEIHPEQKAIIVSGFSETDRVHAAQGLGAGAYVRKPYVIEKLGMAVRKELDRQ
jgi:two-component system, cell cycle sensor histidine kinase and response regulator CckA